MQKPQHSTFAIVKKFDPGPKEDPALPTMLSEQKYTRKRSFE
jgi:hypothetical protein